MASTTKRERVDVRSAGSHGNDGARPGAEPGAQAAPLDMLLSEAAIGPAQRWNPGVAGLKAAGQLALQPRGVARASARVAEALTKIAVGRAKGEPSRSDRRCK